LLFLFLIIFIDNQVYTIIQKLYNGFTSLLQDLLGSWS